MHTLQQNKHKNLPLRKRVIAFFNRTLVALALNPAFDTVVYTTIIMSRYNCKILICACTCVCTDDVYVDMDSVLRALHECAPCIQFCAPNVPLALLAK
jgi:hypothetical protein